jgi:hypothetical protein
MTFPKKSQPVRQGDSEPFRDPFRDKMNSSGPAGKRFTEVILAPISRSQPEGKSPLLDTVDIPVPFYIHLFTFIGVERLRASLKGSERLPGSLLTRLYSQAENAQGVSTRIKFLVPANEKFTTASPLASVAKVATSTTLPVTMVV